MTQEQKKQLIILRRRGEGYGQIASSIGISINTVKAFCRRNGLVTEVDDTVCVQCGRPVSQNPRRKRKRFCCDACRNKWWNSHKELVLRKSVHTFSCSNCGEEFSAYGDSHRKFCCHECYIEYRFRGGRHE